MSNFQSINDEEIEQDALVADVATLNTSVLNINNKINLTTSSNMKTAIDLNTAKTTFPGFGTSEGTALQGNTTTISGAQATAINANSLKTTFPGFGTSGGTALEGNTSLLQLGTSSSTALAGDTSLLQLGTSSSTALAGDTVTISSAQSNAITANTAKVSSQWTTNGNDIYVGDKNIGINNTDPNCSLEIGDSSDVERIRLNGPNGVAISSELLFTDTLINNLTPYFNGMGFQYDSDANRLHVIGDGNDDATATKYMTFDRSTEFVGINDTSPDFRLDVNGDINTSEEFRYYGEPVPMIIAKTSLNSATVSTHRFGYGQGANNTGGSHTDNTFYMPDTNFRVAFRPTSSLAYIEIDYFMDRYFSGRNLYWALGTSTAQSSIIGKTVTFARGANSEWTSRKEKVRIHLSGLTPYSFYVRYIFVKEIVILSNNTVGSNSSAGWIHWGGYNSHSDGGGQTIGHYEIDNSPETPSNSDNFGPLEATVYSVPSTFTTSSSTINPFQYIGY